MTYAGVFHTLEFVNKIISMIGIFDSGVGGLAYAKHLCSVLPQYDFIYLGDQLRVPYGGRSTESVKQMSEECIKKLWGLGANLIIVACNTASAEALRGLQKKYPDKKILGVLIPGVEKALEGHGDIGVIGTRGTIYSHAYKTEIQKRDQTRNVFEIATPLLVPFIEEGMGKSPECKKICKKYLRSLKDAGIKNLILGCTHYPHIFEVFKKIMGSQVAIIDTGHEAAIKLIDYLKRHSEVESQLSKCGKRVFYTTDCPENFGKQILRFYGEKVECKKMEL